MSLDSGMLNKLVVPVRSFGILLFLTGMSAAHAPIVSVTTDAQNYSVGASVAVDVSVSNISDLYGFQFDLNFSPAVLSALSSSEGTFLPTGGSTFFINGTNDNVAGTVSATADTLIGAIPGVSGSGSLAKFLFTAVGQGSSGISLANVQLLDSSLNPISANSVNATVSVSAVPIPGSLPLLTSGSV